MNNTPLAIAEFEADEQPFFSVRQLALLQHLIDEKLDHGEGYAFVHKIDEWAYDDTHFVVNEQPKKEGESPELARTVVAILKPVLASIWAEITPEKLREIGDAYLEGCLERIDRMDKHYVDRAEYHLKAIEDYGFVRPTLRRKVSVAKQKALATASVNDVTEAIENLTDISAVITVLHILSGQDVDESASNVQKVHRNYEPNDNHPFVEYLMRELIGDAFKENEATKDDAFIYAKAVTHLWSNQFNGETWAEFLRAAWRGQEIEDTRKLRTIADSEWKVFDDSEADDYAREAARIDFESLDFGDFDEWDIDRDGWIDERLQDGRGDLIAESGNSEIEVKITTEIGIFMLNKILGAIVVNEDNIGDYLTDDWLLDEDLYLYQVV